MIIFTIGFICYALGHPERAWPWPNWITNIIYFIYMTFAVIFLISLFENGKLFFNKICHGISTILLVAFVIKLFRDIYVYHTTLNSAPFYIWLVVDMIYFIVPAIILLVIGKVVQK
jgi:hypothetical protein